MTYVIAEPCIDVLDESCVSVCPVDCIHFDAGTDRMLSIDPNECIDCGACEPECPVNAIYPEESLPPEWAPVHRRSTRSGSTTRRRPARPADRRAQAARLTPLAGPRPRHAERPYTGPVRIVSLLPSATEIVFALGLGDELVGRQRGLRLPARRPPHPGREPPDARTCRARPSREINAAVEDVDARHEPLYALDDAALAAAEPGPDPDPGAVPRVRGRLSRGQRGRPPARRRRDGDQPRAGVDRGDPQLDPDGGRDDGGRGRGGRRRRGPARAAAGASRRSSSGAATTASSRRASRRSSGSTRRSPSATGCPSRCAWPAAGSCSAQEGGRSVETTWAALAEVDPEILVLMPCGFGLAGHDRRVGADAEARRAGPSCARSGRAACSRSTGPALFSRPGPAGHRRHRGARRADRPGRVRRDVAARTRWARVG